MSLTPFTREQMRAFKAQKDEETRNLKIDTIVKKIYDEAVRFAELNSETVFRVKYLNSTDNLNYMIPISTYYQLKIKREEVEANKEEILSRLRILFPDSKVEYKKVSIAKGKGGKEFDISTLDDNILQLIDIRQSTTEEYIVIDWS
jgi:hypothetical protein